VVVDDTGFPKQARILWALIDSIPDSGQNRQLPGRGESAPCGEQGIGSWLAIVSAETWTKDPERRRAGFRKLSLRRSGNWRWNYSISTKLGLAGPDCTWRCGYGEATEFRDGWKSEVYATRWASRANRSLDQSAQDQSAGIQRAWRSADEVDYGDQRPSSVKDVALKAKG